MLLALFVSPLIGFWAGYGLHRLMKALWPAQAPARERHTALEPVRHRRTGFPTVRLTRKRAWESTLVLLLGAFWEQFAVPFRVMLGCAVGDDAWASSRAAGASSARSGFPPTACVRCTPSIRSSPSAGGSSPLRSPGAPVSTTHMVAASLMGIGARSARRRCAGRRRARSRPPAITIPGSALVSILCTPCCELWVGTE